MSIVSDTLLTVLPGKRKQTPADGYHSTEYVASTTASLLILELEAE